MRQLDFKSSLHESINGLIAQKRAIGYKYIASAWALYKFDQFCVDLHYTQTIITRELAYASMALG